MAKNNFFPDRPESNPVIYAYTDTNPQYKGLLKVGFTNIDAQTRVARQYPTKRPGELPYKIVLEAPAMRKDGSTFTDHEVHRQLRKMGRSEERRVGTAQRPRHGASGRRQRHRD